MSLGTPANPRGKVLEFDEFIEHQIARTRSRIKATDLSTAALTLLLGFLALLFLEIVLDHAVGLPVGFRRATLIVGLTAGFVYSALKIVLPLLSRVNSIYAAKTIEDADPTFKNSLINYLELKRDRTRVSKAAMAMLESRAVADLTHVEVDSVVNQHRLMKAFYALSGTIVFFCFYAFFTPKSILDSTKRAFLADVVRPTNTKLVNIKPGDNPELAEVVAGSHVDFAVDVQGLRPSRVLLHYSVDGGKFFALREFSPGRHEYDAWQLNLPNVQQSMDYFLTAGDGESLHYRLKVLPAPTITAVSHDLLFPAYTKTPPRTDIEGGVIEAIVGTTVVIHAVANTAARAATINIAGESVVPMDVASDDPTRLTGRFNVAKSGTYTVSFRTTGGQLNPNPVVYDLIAIPDREPTAKFILPDKPTIKVPANVKVDLVMAGSDDHGVKDATLHVTLGNEKLLSKNVLEGKPSLPEFKVHETLDLALLKLKPGSRLEYKLAVRDNKDPTSNRFETAKQVIEIGEPAAPKEQRKIEEDRRKELDQVDPPNPAPSTDPVTDQPPAEQNESTKPDDTGKADPAQGQPDGQTNPKGANDQAGGTPDQGNAEPRNDPQAGQDGGTKNTPTNEQLRQIEDVMKKKGLIDPKKGSRPQATPPRPGSSANPSPSNDPTSGQQPPSGQDNADPAATGKQRPRAENPGSTNPPGSQPNAPTPGSGDSSPESNPADPSGTRQPSPKPDSQTPNGKADPARPGSNPTDPNSSKPETNANDNTRKPPATNGENMPSKDGPTDQTPRTGNPNTPNAKTQGPSASGDHTPQKGDPTSGTPDDPAQPRNPDPAAKDSANGRQPPASSNPAQPPSPSAKTNAEKPANGMGDPATQKPPAPNPNGNPPKNGGETSSSPGSESKPDGTSKTTENTGEPKTPTGEMSKPSAPGDNTPSKPGHNPADGKQTVKPNSPNSKDPAASQDPSQGKPGGDQKDATGNPQPTGDSPNKPGDKLRGDTPATPPDGKMGKPGDNATPQGDKTGKPGDPAKSQGDKTGKPGNNTTPQGDKTGKPGDNTTPQGDKTGKPGDNTTPQGDKTTPPDGSKTDPSNPVSPAQPKAGPMNGEKPDAGKPDAKGESPAQANAPSNPPKSSQPRTGTNADQNPPTGNEPQTQPNDPNAPKTPPTRPASKPPGQAGEMNSDQPTNSQSGKPNPGDAAGAKGSAGEKPNDPGAKPGDPTSQPPSGASASDNPNAPQTPKNGGEPSPSKPRGNSPPNPPGNPPNKGRQKPETSSSTPNGQSPREQDGQSSQDQPTGQRGMRKPPANSATDSQKTQMRERRPGDPPATEKMQGKGTGKGSKSSTQEPTGDEPSQANGDPSSSPTKPGDQGKPGDPGSSKPGDQPPTGTGESPKPQGAMGQNPPKGASSPQKSPSGRPNQPPQGSETGQTKGDPTENDSGSSRPSSEKPNGTEPTAKGQADGQEGQPTSKMGQKPQEESGENPQGAEPGKPGGGSPAANGEQKPGGGPEQGSTGQKQGGDSSQPGKGDPSGGQPSSSGGDKPGQPGSGEPKGGSRSQGSSPGSASKPGGGAGGKPGGAPGGDRSSEPSGPGESNGKGGGGGAGDKGGGEAGKGPGPGNTPGKDGTSPSPTMSEPENPFGDTVAPRDQPQSDLVLRKLPDLLKDEDAVKQLEQQTGLTKGQLEQFATKYQKVDPKQPVGPGREITLKPGEEPGAAPSKDQPRLDPKTRFSTKNQRARGTIAQDEARGNTEGVRVEPPAEFRAKWRGYTSRLGRVATPPRSNVPNPKPNP